MRWWVLNLVATLFCATVAWSMLAIGDLVMAVVNAAAALINLVGFVFGAVISFRRYRARRAA